MKTMFLLLTLLLSISSFATTPIGVDGLVGKYSSYKYPEAYAEVVKVLVEPATLFEPAKYEYQIILDSSYMEDMPLFGGEYDDPTALEVNENSLNLETDQECDDPDCFYFGEIEINVKYSKKGQPYLVVTSYGWKLEGEEEEREFESEYVFFMN